MQLGFEDGAPHLGETEQAKVQYVLYLGKLKRISSSERESRRIYQPSVTHEKDRGFLRHGRERHANGHREGWQVRTESPTGRNAICITFVIKLLLL